MKQPEPGAFGGGSITVVESLEARCCESEELLVAGVGLCVRIAPIGEESEVEIALGACEMMDLQAFDLLADGRFAGQKGRHRYQGAELRRHAAAQVEARQDPG